MIPANREGRYAAPVQGIRMVTAQEFIRIQSAGSYIDFDDVLFLQFIWRVQIADTDYYQLIHCGKRFRNGWYI